MPSSKSIKLLILTVLILYAPFFLRGEFYIPQDILYFFYPWKPVYLKKVHNLELLDVPTYFFPHDIFLNSELKKARFPLWNPYILSGHPIVASGQAGLLYPPKIILHFLFSPATARTLLIIAHTITALLCSFLWLKEQKLCPTAAALGALTMSYNTYSTSWLEFESTPIILTYLPLMMLSFDRASSTGKPYWWIALAASLSLTVHGTHLQLALISTLLAMMYCIYRIVTTVPQGNKVSTAVKLGCSLLLGLALSAPTILPVLELNKYGQRVTFSWDSIHHHTAPLWSLIVSLLNPDLFGNPARGFMLNRCPSNLLYSEFANYVGFVPLLLIILNVSYLIVALIRRARPSHLNPRTNSTLLANAPPLRDRIFWCALMICALNWSAATILYFPIFKFVPFMGKLLPTRFLLIFTTSAAVLSAQGAHMVLTNPKRQQRLFQFAGAITVLWLTWHLWLWNILTTNTRYHQTLSRTGWLNQHIKIPPLDSQEDPLQKLLPLWKANYLYNPQMYLPYLACIALLISLKSSRRTQEYLLLGITAADLLIFATTYNTHLPPDSITPEAPSINQLKAYNSRSPVRIIYKDCAFWNTLEGYGLSIVTGYESLLPARYLETLRRVEPDGRVNMRTINLTNLNSPILDALNTKYAILPPYATLNSKRWRPVYRNKDAVIYLNRRAVKRAYVVGKVIFCPTFDSALQHLTAPHFDPGTTAVIGSPLPGTVHPSAASGKVKITLYTPNRVIIKATLPSAGLLILADQIYPGWRCYIDGTQVPIIPANLICRGVYVPRGAHEIVFQFHPSSFYIGLYVCLAGLTLAFITVITSLIAKPEPASSSATFDNNPETSTH